MLRILASISLFLAIENAHAGTELGAIAKSVLTQQQDAYLPWSIFAERSSPITWETIGVDEGKRVGSAVISMNGFTPEIISKSIQEARWSIALTGNKFGARSLKLDSETACFGVASISENCIVRLGNIDASLKGAGVASQKICAFGPGAMRSEIRRISIPDRPVAYLHSVISEGSGGSSLSVNIFLKANFNSSELEHSTAVCSMLFASSGGTDSSLWYEYKDVLPVR